MAALSRSVGKLPNAQSASKTSLQYPNWGKSMHRKPEKERPRRLIDKDESPSGESLLLRLDGLDDVTNDEALDALAKCLFDSDDEVSE